MPTVKWAARANLTAHEVQYSDGTPMVPQVPVLTLDEIEAWLKGTPTRIDNTVSIEILLAQVQAWKEGK